jgi:epoxyqueuosine reductase
MLAEAYTPDEDPLANLDRPEVATISVYARNRDYHDLVKKRLKRWVAAGHGGARRAPEIKVFVDTAPVMEKPLAAGRRAGLAGQAHQPAGRDMGNWVFLGRDLHHARPAPRRARGRPLRQLPRLPRHLPDRCLSRALPAGCAALHFLPDDRAQGAGGSRSCAPLMGNRIYGCDDCLAVCPWNKFAVSARKPATPRAMT